MVFQSSEDYDGIRSLDEIIPFPTLNLLTKESLQFVMGYTEILYLLQKHEIDSETIE